MILHSQWDSAPYRLGLSRLQSPASGSGCLDRDRAIRRGFLLRLLRWQ
jgi:hypothetical protein